MLLENYGRYNDLSPKFRTELEEKVRAFGKVVRYKFDISNENPDPLKQNGRIVWPSRWTLDPVVFEISDPYEDRVGKSKIKKIGLVRKTNEKGDPEIFERIRLVEGNQGVLRLDLEDTEDFEKAMILELHPKHRGGQFSTKNAIQKFERIDEAKMATDKRTIRTLAIKAASTAQKFSDAEVMEFAQAMAWEEAVSDDMLRNQVEEFAEKNPELFLKLTDGGMVKVQAEVSRALSNNLITFDPAEYKYKWSGTQQTITMLSQVESKTHIEQFAEWLTTGGDQAKEIHKKIQSLLKKS